MIPAAPLLRNPYGLTLLLQCPKSLSAPGRGAIRVLTSELPEQHAKSPRSTPKSEKSADWERNSRGKLGRCTNIA
jgi:hypothetical protein